MQKEIIEMNVQAEHVHLVVWIPPKYAVSNVMGYLKGKLAMGIFQRYERLRKQFWGGHLWARGYFCCSSGNVADEVIAQYIANQNENQDEDFKVDG